MEFSEKLLKLRKSKGMSQEALAERLNTSRQAISKWENGQGFPETEKLLMIGNIFEVSIDYLLKDTVDHNLENEKGYYVSKEMTDGYLMHQKKAAKYVAFGVSGILASYIPYLIFQQSFAIITIAIMVAIGIGLIIAASFIEDEYKILKREPLIFDEKFLKELRNKYTTIKKKYISLIITGICFVFAGGTIVFLFKKGLSFGGDLKLYYSICVLLIVAGLYILIYISSIMESYELLINNKEHINKLSSKLLKRFRDKKEML